MATVTSASTDAQVEAAYDDNASYRTGTSVTANIAMAKDFVTAARILIRRLANSMGKGGAALSYNREMIRQELVDAEKYIQQYGVSDTDNPGPRFTRADFGNFL